MRFLQSLAIVVISSSKNRNGVLPEKKVDEQLIKFCYIFNVHRFGKDGEFLVRAQLVEHIPQEDAKLHQCQLLLFF